MLSLRKLLLVILAKRYRNILELKLRPEIVAIKCIEAARDSSDDCEVLHAGELLSQFK